MRSGTAGGLHVHDDHDDRPRAGVLDDPEQDSTPELRAADVAALLDALGARSADVFGSSGGAVTGLALVTGYPGRVRTFVAHESRDGPPPGPPGNRRRRSSPTAPASSATSFAARRATSPTSPALAASPTRLVIGIGADSAGLSTFLTSRALAERLGLTPAGFPGGHGGFMEQPGPFAEVLRQVLGDG